MNNKPQSIKLTDLTFKELSQLIDIEYKNMVNGKHTKAYLDFKEGLRKSINKEKIIIFK